MKNFKSLCKNVSIEIPTYYTTFTQQELLSHNNFGLSAVEKVIDHNISYGYPIIYIVCLNW